MRPIMSNYVARNEMNLISISKDLISKASN